MSPMALVSWSKVVAPLRRRWDFNVETATRLVKRVRKTVLGEAVEKVELRRKDQKFYTISCNFHL